MEGRAYTVMRADLRRVKCSTEMIFTIVNCVNARNSSQL